MKFESCRIFNGNIYKVKSTNHILSNGDGTKFGSCEKGCLKCKNVVLLKMNERYVPIYYINNIFTYIGIVIKSQKGKYDSRFLDTVPNPFAQVCVDDLKPLFDNPGEYKLKELQRIQKENFYKDYSKRGFECF